MITHSDPTVYFTVYSYLPRVEERRLVHWDSERSDDDQVKQQAQ